MKDSDKRFPAPFTSTGKWSKAKGSAVYNPGGNQEKHRIHNRLAISNARSTRNPAF